MKLYSDDYAPNPRRVRIFINEKGVEDIDVVTVSIMSGKHKTPEFRQKNPSGRLPVLELDDGTCIAESMAICRYLESQYPEPPLFGVDDVDRALVEMWERRMEHELLYVVANCFRHTLPVMAALERPQVAEWGEVNRERAFKRLRALDKQLAGRQYIAGDRFTVADITAVCAVDFGKPAGIRIPEDHENLRQWYARVAGRPSVEATRPGKGS